MPAYLDESASIPIIRLDGDISIADAVEMKIILLTALSSGKELHVKLENATEMDVTALQLLYAAEQDATKSGIRFALDGRVPDDISAVAADAGFEKFLVSQDAK